MCTASTVINFNCTTIAMVCQHNTRNNGTSENRNMVIFVRHGASIYVYFIDKIFTTMSRTEKMPENNNIYVSLHCNV